MKTYLTLDVGGSAIKYALIEENLTIREKSSVPTPMHTLENFIEAIGQIYDQYASQIDGMAISMPGIIDPDRGYQYTGGALKFIENLETVNVLKQRCPTNITIGNDVYINFGCTLLDCGQITIGNNTLLGPNVSIYSGNHSLDAAERIAGALIPEPITIGNRVWIGGGSTVLSGVTIGDDTVIGAGSVVTHDIPSGVVAAGNPCRVLRKITDKDKVGFPI